jgi:hypothetical protein
MCPLPGAQQAGGTPWARKSVRRSVHSLMIVGALRCDLHAIRDHGGTSLRLQAVLVFACKRS